MAKFRQIWSHWFVLHKNVKTMRLFLSKTILLNYLLHSKWPTIGVSAKGEIKTFEIFSKKLYNIEHWKNLSCGNFAFQQIFQGSVLTTFLSILRRIFHKFPIKTKQEMVSRQNLSQKFDFY